MDAAVKAKGALNKMPYQDGMLDYPFRLSDMPVVSQHMSTANTAAAPNPGAHLRTLRSSTRAASGVAVITHAWASTADSQSCLGHHEH